MRLRQSQRSNSLAQQPLLYCQRLALRQAEPLIFHRSVFRIVLHATSQSPPTSATSLMNPMKRIIALTADVLLLNEGEERCIIIE